METDEIEKLYFIAPRCPKECIHQGGYMQQEDHFSGKDAEQFAINLIQNELWNRYQ